MQERILVIGAKGQLGMELTDALIDRYGLGAVIPSDIRTDNDSSRLEQLDVLDRERLFSFIKENEITQIYNLAAILSAKGESNPKLAWQLNIDGLLNVLDAAVEHKVSKVYWPSSIAVFGPSTPKVMTPQHTLMEPTTVYGISKLAGERWCEWYHKRYGLDVRSLRYPGLIGYKAKAGGGTTDYAVDIFFKAITEGKYECFLEADTYLPMMYMQDAVKATLGIMDADANKIAIRSSYNIGAMSFSPNELASEILKLIPDFHIIYRPDNRQKIAEGWPKSIDDSCARGDWGWSNDFQIESMAEDMLRNLRVLAATNG